MPVDYDSHPSDLDTVQGGVVTETSSSIKELRAAVPAHCFRPSYSTSLGYLLRDLIVAGVFGRLALVVIPQIPSLLLRGVAWIVYGWAQGLVFTGLWVLGHECGHGSFSVSPWLNDFVGFTLHSLLLTPYFSWKSSHRRHHIYANHMELDHNYVPPRHETYVQSLGEKAQEAGEDAPLYILVRILMQQLLGFPVYLFSNITASRKSMIRTPSTTFLGNSHFAPFGALFRPEEAGVIIASDLGVGLTIALLFLMSVPFGSWVTTLLYVQPYLWLNHWIVAITYLHHTHPELPKFEPDTWTFIKGATATVDREMGFIGKHFFHNIVEFHVIHHLFSRIPHYHTEEATRAIQPLLGKLYHEDKERAFIPSIWESFTKCQWVGPSVSQNAEPGTLWYREGRIPPPEYGVARKLSAFSLF